MHVRPETSAQRRFGLCIILHPKPLLHDLLEPERLDHLEFRQAFAHGAGGAFGGVLRAFKGFLNALADQRVQNTQWQDNQQQTKSQSRILQKQRSKCHDHRQTLTRDERQFKGQKISMLIASANKEQKTLTLEVGSMKNPNIFSSETVVGTIEGVQSLARGSVVGVLYGSPAFKAGFKTGDEIVSVDSKKIARWSDLEIFFGSVNSLSTDMIDFEVERNSENETARSKSKISLKLADLKKFKSISDFGLEYSELYLYQVVKGSPAEMADLKKNDKLIAINSKKLNKWEEVLNSIKSFDGKEALNITLIRDGTELTKKNYAACDKPNDSDGPRRQTLHNWDRAHGCFCAT